ncbi:hypothetical protein M9H77_10887 [Catharanthus roseus]|uniref:Uncharacterized protein n=1 Tax=Catharanthus roseus TaxID=4058 RepID=A0ACC0BD88_CATRO|nr:hypothetical protein M9H77_10887 [Catharanthus roseus]
MDDISSFCMKAARGGGNGGGGGGTKCGRWNPTAEQVKVLTDLFRSGLRTPSTDQIQRISSQLSYYGKIESKNVFYWFQNHKARERQKRRRVSTAKENHHPLQHNNLNNNSSSLTHFAEINEVIQSEERVIETLQLFPLNSFSETNSEKLRYLEYKENASSFSTYNNFGAYDDQMDHPTLDLRLSFL